MTFEKTTVTLRDGRLCVLRPTCAEDAESMLEYLRKTATETPFLINTEEDLKGMGMTVESEALFLNHALTSPDRLMIVAEVNGRLAGNCELRFKRKVKECHRASIGIALTREYWGLGIGTAMFRMMEAFAMARGGIRQLELEYVEGNSRARALYEKMGFRIAGVHPGAILQPDGALVNSYLMIKELKA